MAENNTLKGKKSKYEILQNKEGEILIMISQGAGGPETPLFVYDGGDSALLYRNQDSVVYFEHIATAARGPLKAVSELKIVEIENDDVVREYKVPQRIVKDVKSFMN